MAEPEQTQIVTRAGEMDLIAGERLHCLELLAGDEVEYRHVVGPLGLKIGRTAPADVVIADSDISRSHCLVILKDDQLLVNDLGSTNGTFIDGTRVTEATPLPVGSILQFGKRALKHESRTRSEIAHSNEMTREIARAAAYVKALLPPPANDGLFTADWVYQPSAKLGGDAFGYGKLSEHLHVAYLIDVAGHGAGAAMHAVAIMNQLRQRSLPNTDMSRPELVLSTLNELFQMEDHAGLYFTIWYGVYDTRTRILEYASGGHHAAYMVDPDKTDAIPLLTRNVIIGAMPAMRFRHASVEVPPSSSIYLFSDGVFEIVDRNGKQWDVSDFVELILAQGQDGEAEPQRLFKAVSAQTGSFDDDFSLLVVTFH